MDLKEIKELIELIAEKRLAEFEMERGEFKLKIRHSIGAPAVEIQPSTIAALPSSSLTPALPVATSQASTEKPAAATTTTETKIEKELHKIKAPIVGTFYRAPSPAADSFVKMGSRVGPGTVLCIIEAMKLMNEIEADVSGEIVEIYAENGHAVEYGQPLFGIKID